MARGPKTSSSIVRCSPIRSARHATTSSAIWSTYQLQKGDTLLDVGRWFGLSAKEISDANNHMDWWSPPVGAKVVLPDEHILPDTPRVGFVLNIPEMRLYYYYPSPTGPLHPKAKGKVTPAKFAARQKALRGGVTP